MPGGTFDLAGLNFHVLLNELSAANKASEVAKTILTLLAYALVFPFDETEGEHAFRYLN